MDRGFPYSPHQVSDQRPATTGEGTLNLVLCCAFACIKYQRISPNSLHTEVFVKFVK